jgi:hypothetical protein
MCHECIVLQGLSQVHEHLNATPTLTAVLLLSSPSDVSFSRHPKLGAFIIGRHTHEGGCMSASTKEKQDLDYGYDLGL